MTCKIGITTNSEARRVYWQNRSIGFANWEILNIFRCKAAAKEFETAYAFRNGCEVTPDYADAPSTGREPVPEYEWWYVYHFDYETEIP
jgi:hypothetical protein